MADAVSTAAGLREGLLSPQRLCRSWETGDVEWQGQVWSIVCEPLSQPISFQVSTCDWYTPDMGTSTLTGMASCQKCSQMVYVY